MRQGEFTISTTSGNVHGVEWVPQDNKVLGVICLVHGLGEHSQRYTHVAESLGRAGFAFLAIDLWGHGRSPGKRGHMLDYSLTMDLISELLARARNRFPKRPLFLYGHSMGGNLVLNYIGRKQPQIAGAIVTGPWVRLVKPLPQFLITTVKLISAVYPSLTLPNGLSSEYLSHDSEVVTAYDNDPLVHNRISARTFTQLNQAGEWIIKNADNVKLPLLLMHGGSDHITSPQASQELADMIGENCTCRIWDGMYHEIHNEIGKEKVLDYIAGWLAGRCASVQNPDR